MKVIEMVNQKIIDNQNVSEAAPESCAGMRFKNTAAMVYERTTPLQFWKYSGLGFWVSYEKNFNFLVTIVTSELGVVITKSIYVFYGHILR